MFLVGDVGYFVYIIEFSFLLTQGHFGKTRLAFECSAISTQWPADFLLVNIFFLFDKIF